MCLPLFAWFPELHLTADATMQIATCLLRDNGLCIANAGMVAFAIAGQPA